MTGSVLSLREVTGGYHGEAVLRGLTMDFVPLAHFAGVAQVGEPAMGHQAPPPPCWGAPLWWGAIFSAA